MADLKERLRETLVMHTMCTEAADRIEALEAALAPFAKVGYDIISSRDDAETIDDTMAAERLTWGDLRNAARALASHGGE